MASNLLIGLLLNTVLYVRYDATLWLDLSREATVTSGTLIVRYDPTRLDIRTIAMEPTNPCGAEMLDDDRGELRIELHCRSPWRTSRVAGFVVRPLVAGETTVRVVHATVVEDAVGVGREISIRP